MYLNSLLHIPEEKMNKTDIFFVDEYPTTASGKIHKYKLRELAIQLSRN